jgi:hypothetical protein
MKKKYSERWKKEKRKLVERIGKLSQPIWAQIEEKCFLKFCIDRPIYHGGKYNGKALVKLFNKADEVMEAVKNYLLTNITENRRCSNTEVDEVASMFSNVFLVFDSVFSLAQTPVGLLTPDNKEKTSNYLSMAM